MSNKHYVIIIPGLGDGAKKLELATSFWHCYDLEPVVHAVGWYDGEPFESKLQKIIQLIDRYVKGGNLVSLVGCSAGGSAVLNAFFERQKTVHKVINVCGRLRKGNQTGFRSFESRTASSPPFAQSVILAERHEKLLSNQDRQKIMTVQPLFGDEVVPADTAVLRGAYNITIPTTEHVLSIALSKRIILNKK